MGIIYLVSKHFDEHKVKQEAMLDFDGVLQGASGKTLSDGTIILRQELSMKEKIKTLLHELLHQDPTYGGPLPSKSPLAAKNREDHPDNKKHETLIDKEMEDTYSCQPLLVNYLEHRLGLEEHPEMQFLIDRARGVRQLFYSYKFDAKTNELCRVF